MLQLMNLPIAEPSAERMKATVAALAARELAGRRVATPGGAAARSRLSAANRATECNTVTAIT